MLKQDDTYENILDQCPPDFQLCRRHGDANMIKDFRQYDEKTLLQKKENNDSLVCQCCNMPTSKLVKKFRICVNTDKLDILGSGFPLYFSFKRYIFYMLFFMFIWIGIYSFIVNVVQKSKGDAWV